MQVKTIKFIKKSKLIHDKKYDYSLSNYINAKTKVKIICPVHGEFEQLPHNHYKGNGCPKCIYNKLSKFDIIPQFKESHGDKYNYSKVKYINTDIKVKIICPIHGEFEQTPYNHKRGQGCPKCVGKQLTDYELISEFKKIHGNKYQYDLIKDGKIKIICPIHGEFEQTSNNHKRGQGCSKCAGNEKLNIVNVINHFKESHGSKYDYSKINYVNAHTKVKIICPTHGEFEQTPNNHKNGNSCPACIESNGERLVRLYLTKKNIKFTTQYKFKDCKNILPLPFDFYLPDYNLCIEYNGLQHYKIIEYFGGSSGFIKRIKNDKIKMEYCYKNNIPLIIIKYNDNIDLILSKQMW